MAHYAKLGINSKVIAVNVVNDSDCLNADGIEDEEVGRQFLERIHNWPLWKKTSYNTSRGEHKNGGTPLRGNYAGIGFIWDEDNKKELGRIEGYTQKSRFYSQLSEVMVMVNKGFIPGRREGSGGDHRREGSSPEIMEHQYKSSEEAKRASEILGLGGEIHTHETREGTIYMPGSTM